MSLEGKRLRSSTVFILLCTTTLHSVSGPRQPSRAPAQSIRKQSAIKCIFSHLDNMACSAARASQGSQEGVWCNFAPYCCNTHPSTTTTGRGPRQSETSAWVALGLKTLTRTELFAALCSRSICWLKDHFFFVFGIPKIPSARSGQEQRKSWERR